MLESAPTVRAVTVLKEIRRRHPEISQGVRRTLERRIRDWRSSSCSIHVAFFGQNHLSGQHIVDDQMRLEAEFFAQVIAEESTTAITYLGGERTNDTIWVRGDIRAGRSEAARQQLMENVMKDISAIASVKEGRIWVYLRNLVPTDMIE
jgi:hypothetical protein